MKVHPLQNLFAVLVLVLLGSPAFAQTKHFLLTNNDNAGGNSISFYLAGGTPTSPKLSLKKTVNTGGSGVGNGFFATNGIVVVRTSTNVCAFVADAGSGDIAGISLQTQSLTGNFKGASGDTGSFFGIGVAANGSHLYASFTDANNIGTFVIGAGCTLTFVGDTSAVGLNGFPVDGMSLHGSTLVVAYDDGSIQSFNTSSGMPVSNNDEQLSSGYLTDGAFPSGVDITQDGHFAIFGDACATLACSPSEVEVSDISSGKLSTTVEYGGPSGGLGSGLNSNNVRLSPDESLLYISNNVSGQVTAAFFDKSTGTVSAGCISSALKGFNAPWTHTVSLATQGTTGTGAVLWVAEFGNPSSIGILSVHSLGGTCTLTESTASPVTDSSSPGLLSIIAYPPRPF